MSTGFIDEDTEESSPLSPATPRFHKVPVNGNHKNSEVATPLPILTLEDGVFDTRYFRRFHIFLHKVSPNSHRVVEDASHPREGDIADAVAADALTSSDGIVAPADLLPDSVAVVHELEIHPGTTQPDGSLAATVDGFAVTNRPIPAAVDDASRTGRTAAGIDSVALIFNDGPASQVLQSDSSLHQVENPATEIRSAIDAASHPVDNGEIREPVESIAAAADGNERENLAPPQSRTPSFPPAETSEAFRPLGFHFTPHTSFSSPHFPGEPSNYHSLPNSQFGIRPVSAGHFFPRQPYSYTQSFPGYDITSSANSHGNPPNPEYRPLSHSYGPIRYRANVDLHPLLSVAHSPLIEWDLTESPSLVLAQKSSHEAFYEPATHPSVSTMTIMFHSPALTLSLAAPAEARFLSVFEVVTQLHTKLQKSINRAEFASLSDAEAKEVAKAFYRRCQRKGDDASAEVQKGVKRVDYLRGRTRFRGLSWAEWPDAWTLHVS